jgi:hypothetical protein
MKAKLDTTISLGSLVSMLALLGAIAGAWHSLDTRLTILELQASESKADHVKIDKLQAYMLTKDPTLLPLVGDKIPVVHTFGFTMPGVGTAADQAQMPASLAPKK